MAGHFLSQWRGFKTQETNNNEQQNSTAAGAVHSVYWLAAEIASHAPSGIMDLASGGMSCQQGEHPTDPRPAARSYAAHTPLTSQRSAYAAAGKPTVHDHVE